MILIVAARPHVDPRLLDDLLARYDHAQTPDAREQVAGEIEGLVVGPQVQGILAHQLSGLVDPNDLPALTTELIRKALDESGTTRLRRGQDISVDHLVERLRRGGDEASRRLVAIFPEEVRTLLTENYLRSSDQQAIVDYLNDVVLRMPDLASRLGQPPQEISPSMQRRTADNAALLARLFGDAISSVPKPSRDLVGFIASYLVPEAKRKLLREKSPNITDAMRANWRQLQPVVEALRGELGRQPEPEEVHAELRRRNAEQYGDAIRWFEQKIQEVQPNNPFRLKDPASLAFAKTLLKEHGYSEDFWAQGGKYYVPKTALKGMSLATVKTLMSTPGLGAPSAPSAEHLLPTAPAAEQAETPDWSPLMTGGQDRLQSAIINQLFGEPQYEAEYAVAHYLVQRPDPAPAEVERFLEGLSENVADDIRQIGWDAMVREVDDRIRAFLRDPGAVQEIATELGMSSGVAQRTADAIRRTIFARCTRSLSRECAGIPPRLGSSSVQLDGRGRAYLGAAHRLLSPEGVEAMREVAEYIAGNPVPTASQVDELLASLPEHVAIFLREHGWNRISKAVDAAIIGMMSTDSK